MNPPQVSSSSSSSEAITFPRRPPQTASSSNMDGLVDAGRRRPKTLPDREPLFISSPSLSVSLNLPSSSSSPSLSLSGTMNPPQVSSSSSSSEAITFPRRPPQTASSSNVDCSVAVVIRRPTISLLPGRKPPSVTSPSLSASLKPCSSLSISSFVDNFFKRLRLLTT